MCLQAPEGADHTTVRVGTHRFTFEPPDLGIVRLAGDVIDTDIEQLLEAFEAATTAVTHAYLLIDVTDVGHVTPGARRVAAMRPLPPAYAGLVIFGGTFQQQLVAKLATMAGWFLRGRALGKPMPVCVGDEPTARAWLLKQRPRH